MDASQFLRAQANLLRLERFTDDVVRRFAPVPDTFAINEDFLCRINGIVSNGLDENKNPGQIRKTNVQIRNSEHVPPVWQNVPDHVAEFCRDFNSKWADLDLVALAAFALWRLNWIHPFENGNGRSSRQLAYIILCVKSGGLLPGQRTVIVQLQERRREYETSLRAADNGDHARLQALISNCLTRQLLDGLGD